MLQLIHVIVLSLNINQISRWLLETSVFIALCRDKEVYSSSLLSLSLSFLSSTFTFRDSFRESIL